MGQVTNKVFCYYERLEGWPDGAMLVEMWMDSWRSHGWEVGVLGAEHARSHPYHEIICNSEWLKLTVNEWPYVRACYRRWMAYGQLKSMPWVVHADLDVMNYGFRPEELVIERMDLLHCLDPNGVPCVLHGPWTFYENVCRTFRNVALMRVAGPFSTRDDMSEMNLFLDYWGSGLVNQGVVVDYMKAGWREAKLVHYTHSIVGEPRSPVVRGDREMRGGWRGEGVKSREEEETRKQEEELAGWEAGGVKR